MKEYLKDMNKAAAARRAGFTAMSADKLSHQWFTPTSPLYKPHVAEAIRKEIEDRAKALEVDAYRVLRELTYVGFSDIRRAFDDSGNLLPIHELDPIVAASISGIDLDVSYDRQGNEVSRTKRIRLWPKTQALELIAKHLGMLNEKLQIQTLNVSMTYEEHLKLIEQEARKSLGNGVDGGDGGDGSDSPEPDKSSE